MTLLRSSVVCVLGFNYFLGISLISAAECDLEKIFRTPKHLSKANFDHFELVERNGFDRTDATTTEQPPTIPTTTESSSESTMKKPVSNMANAQVTVKFGGDEVVRGGSNHIMKIPPQCRHIAEHSLHHPADFYYPPPSGHRYPHPHANPASHPHYYHPYPPPVPYVFPNYYFSNYGSELPQYMPSQLKEYFQRHPQFLAVGHPSTGRGVIIRSQPMMNGDHTNFVDARNPVNENIEKILKNSHQPQPEIVVVHPRVLKPLDLNNDEIEEEVAEKAETKRHCADAEKNQQEPPLVVEELEDETNVNSSVISSSSSSSSEEQPPVIIKKHDKKCKDKEIKRKHKHRPKPLSKEHEEDNNLDNLETLLNKALVAYKCQNCTDHKPKMLITYPIAHKEPDHQQIISNIITPNTCPYCNPPPKKFANDLDGLSSLNAEHVIDGCKCKNCKCNESSKKDVISSGRKFAKDMDDLIIVMAEIIDPSPVDIGPKPQSPQENPQLSYPNLAPPAYPKITQMSLNLPDTKYSDIRKIPLIATFDVDLGDYLGRRRTAQAEPTSPSYGRAACDSTPKVFHSEVSVSSAAGYTADPHNIVTYQTPTEVKYTSTEPIVFPRKVVDADERPFVLPREVLLPEEDLEYKNDCLNEPFVLPRKVVIPEPFVIPNKVVLPEEALDYRRYAAPVGPYALPRPAVVPEDNYLANYLRVLLNQPKIGSIPCPGRDNQARRDDYLPKVLPDSFVEDHIYPAGNVFIPEPKVSIARKAVPDSYFEDAQINSYGTPTHFFFPEPNVSPVRPGVSLATQSNIVPVSFEDPQLPAYGTPSQYLFPEPNVSPVRPAVPPAKLSNIVPVSFEEAQLPAYGTPAHFLFPEPYLAQVSQALTSAMAKQSNQMPASLENAQIHPYGAPSHYLFPESNVLPVRKPQDALPKYLKVIPRDDLEFATIANEPTGVVAPVDRIPVGVDAVENSVTKQGVINYCRNCGHNHANCGHNHVAAALDRIPVGVDAVGPQVNSVAKHEVIHYCRNCGHNHANCGHNHVVAAVDHIPVGVEAVEPQVNSVAKQGVINYCRNCGHNHTGGKFCSNCGTPVVSQATPRANNPVKSRSTCPYCPKETRQLNDW